MHVHRKDIMSTTLLGFLPYVIGVIVLLALVIGLFKAAWRVAEPNEALIISGIAKKGANQTDSTFKIVTGQGTLVIPGVQVVRKLSLNLIECPLEVDCVTSQGVKVSVKGCVIFKVGDTPAEISNAARRFLGKSEQEMLNKVNSIFDGHLRAIVGNMTMEKLISDRDELRDNVRAASGTEMGDLGLKIDSLQLLEIVDPSNYIENIRAPHVALAEANARIARAAQDQAATEKEQAANIAMAEAKTTAAKRQAELKAESDSAQQKAAQAGPLADAIARQQVVEAATRTAELEADRTAKELETKVKRPADAAAYAAAKQAEGERDAAIAKAQADAQRVELSATADAKRVELAATAEANRVRVNAEATASATRATGEAEAAATQAKGLAEAEAVKAKALAEAEGMDKRADALNKGQDALIAQQVAAQLPAIVAELVKPWASVGSLTVLDGADGFNKAVVGGISQLGNVLPGIMSAVTDSSASNKADSTPMA